LANVPLVVCCTVPTFTDQAGSIVANGTYVPEL
jgi:hypothetical protein